MTEQWDMEDEYDHLEPVEESKGNGFGSVAKTNDTGGLPQSVIDLLTKYAERTNMKLPDAIKAFAEDVKKNFGEDVTTEPDEDLVLDWCEGFVVETRRQTGSGNSNLSTWVGCFLGVADKKADRQKNIVRANLKLFKEDPNHAVSSGRVGVYSKGKEFWEVETKGDTITTEYPVTEQPPYVIPYTGKEKLCLTSYNGQPTHYEKFGRYAYFLGNEESKFVNDGDIQLWRVDLTGDHVYKDLKIGEACKIPVTPPKEGGLEAFKDVLGIYSNFEIEYTNTFVSEDMRSLLHPAKYWTSPEFHDMFVSIDSLEEAYEQRKQTFTINGEKRVGGPLVITKATIVNMNTSPRDSDYDQEGHNYVMTLTSPIAGDISCWISGAVGMMTDPFTTGGGKEFPYGEKSTVYVFGRIGMRTVDGLSTPKITAHGIFGDWRRCRQRATGGDTGVGQFD